MHKMQIDCRYSSLLGYRKGILCMQDLINDTAKKDIYSEHMIITRVRSILVSPKICGTKWQRWLTGNQETAGVAKSTGCEV